LRSCIRRLPYPRLHKIKSLTNIKKFTVLLYSRFSMDGKISAILTLLHMSLHAKRQFLICGDVTVPKILDKHVEIDSRRLHIQCNKVRLTFCNLLQLLYMQCLMNVPVRVLEILSYCISFYLIIIVCQQKST